jgi:hypothetical protein
VEFTIPSFNKTMSEKVRVIRTTDQFVGTSVTGKSYFVEMHFVNIDHNNVRRIREFEKLT